MPRVKKSVASRARRKRIINQAKGYTGMRKNTFKLAKEAVERGLVFAYRDRRNKKRSFRALWIVRINVGARLFGLTYSKFINGIAKAGVTINRKILADLAVTDQVAFEKLAVIAKENS